MFIHREISNKVHGLTHSENTRHLLVWVYCECCVRFERIIHSICADFALQRSLFFCHCIMPCAHQSKHHTCIRVKMSHLCVKNLTAICNWGFLWKAQGTRRMGVSSRVSEVTPIVKGMDNIGYLYIHEQGLPLKFFFCIRVPLVTESLESLSKDISWMVLH